MKIIKLLKFSSLIFLALIVLISCKSNRITISQIEGINCLKLDHKLNYNTSFNPLWIAKHKIKKVVKQNFFNNNGTIEIKSGSDVYEFNDDGYLKYSYTTYANPRRKKESIKNVKNIGVIHEYTYEEIDSFLILHHKIINLVDRDWKKIKPDTINALNGVINHTSARYYDNDKKTLAKNYIYDKRNRLIEIRDGLGELKIKYTYISDNEIEILKNYTWQKKIPKSYVKLNASGQIVENINLNENWFFKFEYDKSGALIKQSRFIENKLNYYSKFEYFN